MKTKIRPACASTADRSEYQTKSVGTTPAWRRSRKWCKSCGAYTNHAVQLGCCVCTGVEPPAPADCPVHVTVLGLRYGGKIAIEATYAEDGAPVRTDRFDVSAGRTLRTIHSFRPRTVHVRGHSYHRSLS